MTGGMTVNAYAKKRGCTHVAVWKAIKTGRLVKSITKNPKGKIIIDEQMANAEWEVNSDASKVRGKQDNITGSFVEGVTGKSEASPGFKARQLSEVLKAKILELDYNERVGKLVEAEKVRDESYRIGRALRDVMLNIPDRVAAELGGMTDPALIHARLKEEIINGLESMKDHAFKQEA